MKGTCIANSGKALTQKYLVIGDTKDTVFHLTIGKVYGIFGIAVYRGVPLFLLCGDDDLPDWYPTDLFLISDPRVPKDWFAALYPGNDVGLQFLIGYERMVTDQLHYDALLERDPAALESFRLEKRKYEQLQSG